MSSIVNQMRLVAPPTDPEHLTHKKYVDDKAVVLTTRLDALGSMAKAADAPVNGKSHMRKDGAWVENSASAAVCGIMGEIRLLPFRQANLPFGWYFCNGDRYNLSTAQGFALNALPAVMKTDWGIIISGSNINLPDLFSGGEGYFFRPINNSSRNPGSKQTDAIRNITGTFNMGALVGLVLNGASTGTSKLEGVFKSMTFNKSYSLSGSAVGMNSVSDLAFDASRSVATAEENRPMNVGMTPAIYLGV